MRRSLLLYAILLVSLLPTALLPAKPPDWAALELVGGRVEPGAKAKFSYQPESTFEGAYLDFPIFGARPGPTLCVTSGIHGDELNSVEIARRA